MPVQPKALDTNIAQSVIELIGNTPLLQLNHYGAAHGLGGSILAKLEYLNPAGSVKDRIGYALIAQAIADGRLAPGGTIIEPTSGNTGIALAAYGAALGYRVIIVLPESLSVERRAQCHEDNGQFERTARSAAAGRVAPCRIRACCAARVVGQGQAITRSPLGVGCESWARQ